MTTTERRKYPRIPMNIVSDLRKAGESEAEAGRLREQVLGRPRESALRNLSIRGCFIESDLPFQEGDAVAFRLFLPNTAARMDVIGVVRWTQHDPRGIGVEIVDPTPEDLAHLERYVAFRLENDGNPDGR